MMPSRRQRLLEPSISHAGDLTAPSATARHRSTMSVGAISRTLTIEILTRSGSPDWHGAGVRQVERRPEFDSFLRMRRRP
jgi:hypothetical protein